VAQEKQLLSQGDLVVMSAGTLQGIAGSTDLIKVEVVTAVLGHELDWARFGEWSGTGGLPWNGC